MKPEVDISVFSMKSNISFKGFIKNGLDSSMMINLIVSCDSNFDDFRKRGLTFPPHLFYYHEISIP